MLIEIRDKASSWVAYVIIGLLILSFAMWGIQEYFGGGAAAPVAEVNGTEISQVEFNNQLQQYKQRLQQILGNNFRQQYPDDSVIKKDVIDNMVRTELLRQEATDAGYSISKEGLINSIQQVPNFQKDGKFNPVLYEQFFQAQRYSKAQFEQDFREQEKLRQMETSLSTTSFMPKADLLRFQKLSEQTRDFQYAIVKVDPESVSVSEDETSAYYKENQQLFLTPEQVKLSYIELKEEDLANAINITTEDAQAIYDSQPERYMTTELRKIRHILFKVPHETAEDAKEWDQALEKANGIIKELDDGASFADLAKQHSQDSLSAEKGGELGLFAAGDFTSKELEDALFSLNVGDHSQPVRTEQGVQIIKLDEIQESELKPFETVREKILNERKSELARDQYIEITEELANVVFEQPDELPESSGDLDLETKQTGWLAANSGAEIFAYPKIQALAFSENILKDGLNSELIEVEDGHVIAFRLVEHKESETRSLESVSADISRFLGVQKAAKQAIKKGQKFLTDLQAGKTLQELATEQSLEIVSPGAIKRDDSKVPATIMERAFMLSRPEANSVLNDGVTMQDGTYALVELSKVNDGAEAVDDEKVSQLSQRVNYGRREFNAVIEGIRLDSDVQVFENNL